MGEQEVIELDPAVIQQVLIRGAETTLGLLRLVHQVVWHELEVGPVAQAHDPVGARHSAVARHVQRGLIGGNATDLVGDDTAGKLVAEVERHDRAAPIELVQPVPDAVDLAAEGLAQPPRVTIVVAVGEED